ncbi:MAG: sensor histidine kinase [Nitrospirae bacterium]|nr:sensor histidine kinase [Nitrospirota bacterium]
MKDISLHILDLSINSLKAGATDVFISIQENTADDIFKIVVKDNGRGMSSEDIKEAKAHSCVKNKSNFGIGIPLLLKAVQDAEGRLEISSEISIGTTVEAVMKLGHAARKPLGDMGATMATLIACYPDVRFRLSFLKNNQSFSFNSDEFKAEKTSSQSDFKHLKQYINELAGSFE